MSDSDQQVTRRDFLRTTASIPIGASLSLAAAPAALAAPEQAAAPASAAAQPAAPRARGLLLPQRNAMRDLIDSLGILAVPARPEGGGRGEGLVRCLPAPRPIAVPCSWNELFDDARDYLGSPGISRRPGCPRLAGQRVFLRVGSANYAAKVWVNGTW